MKQITILYNSNIEAMMPWRGWKPEDGMQIVLTEPNRFHKDVPDKQICEALFAVFNEIDPVMKLRSMSVGDVIIIGDMAYACDGIGWKEIKKDDVKEDI